MTDDRVKLKYHNGYYDGPISGVAEWQGQRYYFTMIEEAEWDESREEEEPAWSRRYALYALTDEEWAEEDARHAAFEEYVGTHTNYRDDGTRDHRGVKSQENVSKYYETYSQPRPWDTPRAEGRDVVHTFER